MFVLRYDNLNFDATALPDFVESVKNHQYGKRLILKDKVASGDYRILEFSNGFVAWVSNYIMNDDFELELSVKKEDYLALHINQIQAGPEFKVSLNNKAVSYDDKIVTSLFLTTGIDSFVLSGTRGACFNRLKIMIPKVWLTKNFSAYNENLLNAYLNLQDERLYLDSMDNTYRSMVDKVMNTEDNAFYLSVTQNIVVLITERFFNRLNTKMQKNQKENEVSEKLT